jgi:hypothetical protein
MFSWKHVDVSEMDGQGLIPMGGFALSSSEITAGSGLRFSTEFDGFDMCHIAAIRLFGKGEVATSRGRLPLTIDLVVGLRAYLREHLPKGTDVLLPADRYENKHRFLMCLLATGLDVPFTLISWPKDISSETYAMAKSYATARAMHQVAVAADSSWSA